MLLQSLVHDSRIHHNAITYHDAPAHLNYNPLTEGWVVLTAGVTALLEPYIPPSDGPCLESAMGWCSYNMPNTYLQLVKSQFSNGVGTSNAEEDNFYDEVSQIISILSSHPKYDVTAVDADGLNVREYVDM